MYLDKWDSIVQAIAGEMNAEPKEPGKHKVLIGWRAKLEKGPSPLAVFQIDAIVREVRKRLSAEARLAKINTLRAVS